MTERPRPGRAKTSIRRSPRSAAAPDQERTAQLAGMVGHELNNISVPLQGFNDLAQGTAGLSAPLRECLDEINIAVHRVRALAADLQSIGEWEARPERISIGACLPPPAGPGARRITWTCPETTPIYVDRSHAMRAIEALGRATTRGARVVGATLTISRPVTLSASCATCGVRLEGRSVVRVQTEASAAVSRAALRDPFDATMALRGTRRLTLAVLVHCAHRAGGHVLLDRGSGSPGLVFPTV